jgi:hypothetical protein
VPPNTGRSVSISLSIGFADRLTRENGLERAVVRQGSTSTYYIYILYAGVSQEEGLWMVEVHGNDVNWQYDPLTDDYPLTDDFS